MNQITQNIIDTVQVGALASVNEDSSPLVTPLHFARFEDSIIWVSDLNAKHSQNIERTGKAEFVVWNEQKQAVYLKTSVAKVADADIDSVHAAYSAKLGDFMPKFDNPQFYQAPIGEFDENSTTGNWRHYIA